MRSLTTLVGLAGLASALGFVEDIGTCAREESTFRGGPSIASLTSDIRPPLLLPPSLPRLPSNTNTENLQSRPGPNRTFQCPFFFGTYPSFFTVRSCVSVCLPFLPPSFV